MRLSCNGCRILRKGCNDSCTLRPCLEWITSAEAQANATLFLAKFYGRSGLMKLLNSGPNHLRPIIFRSLLYEACGRMVNPVYGSVGLQWSGNWHLCQAAVESVLKGHPLPIDSNVPESSDIKPSLSQLIDSTSTDKPLKPKNRGRFKRPLHRKSKTHGDKLCNFTSDSQGCNLKWQDSYLKEFESMFQIVQEENVRKAGCNNNESATFSAEDTSKADANVEHAKIQGEAAREDPVQEMFYKSISEMENFSDDSNYSKEIDDENGVELELTLGSPVSVETVQPHDFIPCNRHWSSISSCKESSPLINMASLSLALSHPA